MSIRIQILQWQLWPCHSIFFGDHCLPLLFSTSPRTTNLSRLSLFRLGICPQTSSCRMEVLIILAVLSIHLQHHISKASVLCVSRARTVHVTLLYVKIREDQTSDQTHFRKHGGVLIFSNFYQFRNWAFHHADCTFSLKCHTLSHP